MREEVLKKLAEYSGPDAVVSSYELDALLKEHPETVLNLKSFMPTLDEAVDGFRDGELYVISGPTKHGKTLLAQSLTIAFARQLAFPLWFTFEVPARQFLERFGEQIPLVYMPKRLKSHALRWFEDRVWEAFAKYHTRVVFIDHLHFLIDLARMRHPSIEIGMIIRQLKMLAVQGGFLIIILSHTTKGVSEGDLSFEAIRDSSFTAQESDCVVMIKRTPEKGENRARLRVEFHRRTGVFQRVIELEKKDGLLREVGT